MKKPLVALLLTLLIALPVAAQPEAVVEGRTVAEWIGFLRISEEGALETTNPRMRVEGVLSLLCSTGDQTGKTLPGLLAALEAPKTRPVAARCLRRVARNALEARDEPGGMLALRILTSEDAISLATGLLEDPDQVVRANMCSILFLAGPKASDSVPALVKAMSDREWRMRDDAAEALGKIGGEAALSALIAALADEDELFVRGVAKAIGLQGPKAKPAVPALVTALERAWPETTYPAGVLDVGPGAQAEAAFALGRMGRSAKAAVPALAKALGSERLDLRQSAAWALWNVRASESALPALIKALSDDDKVVRKRVAGALERLKAKASPALPELEAAIQREEDRPTRKALLKAIRAIRPKKGRDSKS